MIPALAGDLLEVADLKVFAERAKALQGLSNPLFRTRGIVQAPGTAVLTRLRQASKLHAFKPRQRSQRPDRRQRSFFTTLAGHGDTGALLGLTFVQPLQCFQEQTLIRSENRSRATHVRRQNFERTALPGKNFTEGRFALEVWCCGINNFAVVNPDFRVE